MQEARDLLGLEDLQESGDEGMVSSGSLAVPGLNLDKTVERGTALRIEVACAGEGTVTFTVISGAAKKAERVDCRQPATSAFEFTTAEPSLAIEADSTAEDAVGAAYAVSRRS